VRIRYGIRMRNTKDPTFAPKPRGRRVLSPDGAVRSACLQVPLTEAEIAAFDELAKPAGGRQPLARRALHKICPAISKV
jgi:hypothetical protein